MDDDDKKKVVFCCGGFGCLGGLITLIVWLSIAIQSVDENEVALKWNAITRTVDPDVVTKSGTYVIGFEGRFFKYPKTFQRITLIREEGTALRTRTKEGLDITLDISMEYRLIPEKLKDLFNLVGVNDKGDHIKPYEELYNKMVQSSLRNSAAKFESEAFLTERRGNVSKTMLNDVAKKLRPFHALVTAVQLRNVELELKFKTKIDQVIQEKLTQSQLIKQQEVSLKTAEKDRVTQSEQAKATRARVNIEAERIIQSVINTRQTETIQKDQERQTKIKAAEGDRQALLNSKRGALVRALIDRKGSEQNAQNSLSVEAIKQNDLLAIAEAQTKSIVINARADANKISAEGVASAAGLKEVKDAESDMYGKLKGLPSSGFTNAEVAQYAYAEALGEHTENELFFNYKKVPMLFEGAEDPKVLAKVLGNN